MEPFGTLIWGLTNLEIFLAMISSTISYAPPLSLCASKDFSYTSNRPLEMIPQFADHFVKIPCSLCFILGSFYCYLFKINNLFFGDVSSVFNMFQCIIYLFFYLRHCSFYAQSLI